MRTQDQKASYKVSKRLATWNVRSIYQEKLEIVKNEMERTCTSVLGVSEFKWTGSAGFFQSEKHTVYYSRNENIPSSVLGLYPLNDRLMSIRLQGKPINTTIIQVKGDPQLLQKTEIWRNSMISFNI